MSDLIEWALLHRGDEGTAAEFRELRLFRDELWRCEGVVKTWGTDSYLRFPLATDARAAFDAIIVQWEAAGFTRSAGERYAPGTFDFEALKSEVKEASVSALAATRGAHPDQTICAFGLLTDDGAMTIVPGANSVEALDGLSGAYLDEAKFIVSCWPFGDGDECFDLPYRRLLAQHREVSFDPPIPFEGLKDGLFEVLVEALEELRSEGALDDGKGQQLALLVQITDGEQIDGMLERLNDDPVFIRGYKQFMYG